MVDTEGTTRMFNTGRLLTLTWPRCNGQMEPFARPRQAQSTTCSRRDRAPGPSPAPFRGFGGVPARAPAETRGLGSVRSTTAC